MNTLEMIDNLKQFKSKMINKKVMLFGTGKAAEQLIWLLNLLNVEIKYCIDNDELKWDTKLNEIDVHNPCILKETSIEENIIVVASSFFKEISSQLKDMNFKENIHYINGLNLFNTQLAQTDTESLKIVTEPRTTMRQSIEGIKNIGYYPKNIIDVGVAYGTFPLLEGFPKSRHILIEPLSEFQEAISKLKEKFNIDYIAAAAGKCIGKVTFNVHKNITASSIYDESDGEYADGTKREVDMITLNQLIDEYSIADGALLKVDVQGAELEVLYGAEDLLKLCDVVILEVSFFEFLKGSPQFYEIIAYMKEKGFVVYDLFDGHNRPYDNALAQKDVMFVKENGFFRSSHNWATQAQRIKFEQERFIQHAINLKL